MFLYIANFLYGRIRVAPGAVRWPGVVALKDAVFKRYTQEGCEAREDTLKLLSLVGMLLPFLPVEREHLAQIVAQSLGPRLSQLIEGELGELSGTRNCSWLKLWQGAAL